MGSAEPAEPAFCHSGCMGCHPVHEEQSIACIIILKCMKCNLVHGVCNLAQGVYPFCFYYYYLSSNTIYSNESPELCYPGRSTPPVRSLFLNSRRAKRRMVTGIWSSQNAIIFGRPGRSQGLLYKQPRDSSIDSFIN